MGKTFFITKSFFQEFLRELAIPILIVFYVVIYLNTSVTKIKVHNYLERFYRNFKMWYM